MTQPQYNCVVHAVEWVLRHNNMYGFEQLVRDQLRYNSVPPSITFTKADGTDRRMVCTTNATLLPPAPVAEATSTVTKPSRTQSGTAHAVYDVEQGAWRSFVWTRIRSIEYYDGYRDGTITAEVDK